MRRPDRIGMWWVPLLLTVVPLAGLVPARRDLFDYFAPMRALTADLLAAGTGPWMNLANGCGEAWFANPQTGVLYPPAWLHLVLPTPWAMTLEIALHLALFSLGVGLVARSLGASGSGRALAEVAAWSAGPVLVTVGVLNNLETLSWLPWMVLAARVDGRRSVPLLAATTALAWLAAEPQVWAIGVALSLVVARDRPRALAGLGLGVAVVAVQLVPFLVWVAEGDRGPAAAWLLRGAVSPRQWAGVLAPGVSSTTDHMVYAESLFLGAPLLLCAVLGGWRRRWPLAVVAAMALFATLPEIGGGRFFVLLTGGLIRYPSRFAVLAAALLLPFIGQGADEWLSGRGRWLAAVLSILSLTACAFSTHPWRWWIAGAPALVMLVAATAPAPRRLRGAALIMGAAGVVVAGLPQLGLRPLSEVTRGAPVWPEAADGGRVYVPTPAEDVMRWLASSFEARRLWPVGYLNLVDGLSMARTDAPVANDRLAMHIARADMGPRNRWWLDTLAVPWVVLPEAVGRPDAMEGVVVRGGMRLLRNHAALPVASLAPAPPDPERPRHSFGEATVRELAGNRCTVSIVVPSEAWLWLSLAPVGGWRWWLDGRPVVFEQGPGIVQYLRVEPGAHYLEGRYRPPALGVLTIVSGVALLVVLAGLARCPRRA